MAHSISTQAGISGTALDPDIERFMARIAQSYASQRPIADCTPAEARAVAEFVRAPWTAGGPEMARTFEVKVPTPHGEVRVRLHDPCPSTQPKPVLVYAHGGGWVMFSLDTHDRLMREYASRAGVIVAGVDYALSPEARFPVALEQIAAAIVWIRAHAHELGADPDRIAAGGDSAGANMALASAVMLRDRGETGLLKALHLHYGAFDNVIAPEWESRFGGPDSMLTSAEMDRFWENYLRGPADAGNPLAVPAKAALEGLPPAFLTIPECDVLTGQSLELARRMEASGVRVRAQIYKGATHSFLEAVEISPLAAKALQDGADWLKAELTAGLAQSRQ
ncbi:putative acetyl esterase [Glycocaulis alkaliphilus]|uniref:Putative acetyl esterase n=1 Tax=Glycocaulis alkaliphilus TaxID=1434191 RepID=A0A3T0E9I3_9PROT|nr:alpha/beta hydrolase fold domain-containing protein [Glycocaulis alkaliphilus]AZU04051.1 putative acetyl esterase [Glycocaulis alkaliphilus]GGB75422.1 acetylesterase [Glycocaulis alkaliphilus]